MFQIAHTLRRRETQDGSILLDIHHGQMFCLNVVGSKIMELMQRGYDQTAISGEISRAYGIERAIVEKDVAEFIEDLEKHHILNSVHPADPT